MNPFGIEAPSLSSGYYFNSDVKEETLTASF